MEPWSSSCYSSASASISTPATASAASIGHKYIKVPTSVAIFSDPVFLSISSEQHKKKKAVSVKRTTTRKKFVYYRPPRQILAARRSVQNFHHQYRPAALRPIVLWS